MNNNQKILKQYHFNWETFRVVFGGKSPIDSNTFLGQLAPDKSVENFISGYGFDLNNPIQKAELFGHFQEAVQFIRRYFLDSDFLRPYNLKLPSEIFQITDISQLFIHSSQLREKATNVSLDPATRELSAWTGIILKIMHTILHADKDLRYRYFKVIQTQIFDRFYRYLHRDENENLFLKSDLTGETIPLVEFQTKSQKTRDSLIIKLLHKKENVAEEVFDRIGIRFVTESKLDCLRVAKFLCDNYLVMVHNIIPNRAHNSLFDFAKISQTYSDLEKKLHAIEKENPEQLTEEEVLSQFAAIVDESLAQNPKATHNEHTLEGYRAIHFTCRQLIKYSNPFVERFNRVKDMARESENSETELAKAILDLDTSTISSTLRFFYPFEVQITDTKSHGINTEGEASHESYKQVQLESAIRRLFSVLVPELQAD